MRILVLLLSFATTMVVAEGELDFELPSGITGTLFDEGEFLIDDVDLPGKLLNTEVCFDQEDAEELVLCALEDDVSFDGLRSRVNFPTSSPKETTTNLVGQLAIQSGQPANVVQAVLNNFSIALAATLNNNGIVAVKDLGYFGVFKKETTNSTDSKGNIFRKNGYKEVKFKLSKNFSALDPETGLPLSGKPKKEFVAYANGSPYPPTSIPGLTIVGMIGTHKKGSGHLKYTLPATISWQAPTEEYGTPTTSSAVDGQVTVCSSVPTNCIQLDVVVSQLPTAEITKSVKFFK